METIDFVEEYHAACTPCSTIPPWIVIFSYRSLRRVDRVRKANRVLQSNDGDSARMKRDTMREDEITWKEIISFCIGN